MDIIEIQNRFLDLRMSTHFVLHKYSESHRYYHNLDHISFMLKQAQARGWLTDELFIAIVFHDIVYDPKSKTNEEDSVALLRKIGDYPQVEKAILETKTHDSTTELSKRLCELDLLVLNGDLETFIEFEHKIFREYQWVDYKTYANERVKILKSMNVSPEKIQYVESRRIKVGVYAGSFDPFHKGHLNILEKAEKIFDKVIIARGLNPDKRVHTFDLPEPIKYRQIENYSGLLTDFIDGLGYDVTLIRGLRNANDLQYEQTQYRFLQELKPDIKMISIFCDKEFEHISSSAIKSLSKFGADKIKEYLV